MFNLGWDYFKDYQESLPNMTPPLYCLAKWSWCIDCLSKSSTVSAFSPCTRLFPANCKGFVVFCYRCVDSEQVSLCRGHSWWFGAFQRKIRHGELWSCFTRLLCTVWLVTPCRDCPSVLQPTVCIALCKGIYMYICVCIRYILTTLLFLLKTMDSCCQRISLDNILSENAFTRWRRAVSNQSLLQTCPQKSASVMNQCSFRCLSLMSALQKKPFFIFFLCSGTIYCITKQRRTRNRLKTTQS